MLAIAQATTRAEIDGVAAMLREYTTWAFGLEARSDEAPTFEGLEEELATLPGVYAPPAGRLLLATDDGQPGGCIALKPHDRETSELKRLYVQPSFRGRDIGGQLVATLIAEARKAGYRRIVLDSHHTMKSAHAIYEAAGFRRVGPPADFPASMVPIVVFMEMDLTALGGGTPGGHPSRRRAGGDTAG